MVVDQRYVFLSDSRLSRCSRTDTSSCTVPAFLVMDNQNLRHNPPPLRFPGHALGV
jgi:hypothetical protein